MVLARRARGTGVDRRHRWERRGTNGNDWALSVRSRQQFASFAQFTAYRDWVADADERRERLSRAAAAAAPARAAGRLPSKLGDGGALEFTDGATSAASAASRGDSDGDASSRDGGAPEDAPPPRAIELLADDAGERGAPPAADGDTLPPRMLRYTRKLVSRQARRALRRAAAVEAAGARAARRDLAAFAIARDRRRRETTATPPVDRVLDSL